MAYPAAPAPELADFGFGTPWAEQLAAFRRKLNLPTERWDDILRSAHDRAFIVAGAAKADLLHDLRGAVDRAMETSDLQAFRREFDQVVAKHGWTGWTGEGSAKGRAWRTRVIFQTNLASSYAAGRWAQMNAPEVAQVRPFWRYVHADGVLHPRPHHLAWDGITLPREHAFWKTHFAPNGWGCRCEIWPVKAPAADAKTEPPPGWDTREEATGEPPGIDRGWGYAPGASTDVSLRQMVRDKLITYPPAMAKAMAADMNRRLAPPVPVEDFVRQALAERSAPQLPLWLGFVEAPEKFAEVVQHPLQGYAVLLPPESVRHVHDAHQHDGKDQRPPQPADFAQLMAMIGAPDATAAEDADRKSGNERFSTTLKRAGGEWLRAVWEVRPGPRNRAIALVTMVVKRLRAKG